MMSREELVDAARDLDLDDEVHDVKSEEAATINNGGVPEQIDFLIDAHGFDYVQQLVAGYPPCGNPGPDCAEHNGKCD